MFPKISNRAPEHGRRINHYIYMKTVSKTVSKVSLLSKMRPLTGIDNQIIENVKWPIKDTRHLHDDNNDTDYQLINKKPYQNRINANMSQRYKPAEIYYGSKNGKNILKPWYVYISEVNPATGLYERFIFKGGINRFHTLADRTAQARQLRDTINDEYKAGFSMFKEADIIEAPDVLTLEKAFESAVAIKNRYKAKKTKLGYVSQLRNFMEAVNKLNYQNVPASDLDWDHAENIMQCLVELGASPHKYNKLRQFAWGLCKILSKGKNKKIKFNPFEDIESVSIPETDPYPPFPEYRQKIKERSYEYSYGYGLVLEIFYLTGLRPNEVLGIQLDRINMKTGEVTLLPTVMMEGQADPERITKTRKIRWVYLEAELLDKIKKHIKNSEDELGHPVLKEWFLFAMNRTFYCGPKRLHENRIGDLWRTVIQKDDIPKWVKAYGMKHTRADELVDAGVGLEYIRDKFGHESTIITRIYAKKHAKKAAEVIKEIGPKY